MADISYGVSMRIAKENLANSVNVSNVTADMSVTGMVSQVLTLSSSTVAIDTATLSSVGLAYLHNLSTHTAQTVAIGVMSGATYCPFANPRCGEPGVIRLVAGVDYRATGATGSRLRVDITEG